MTELPPRTTVAIAAVPGFMAAQGKERVGLAGAAPGDMYTLYRGARRGIEAKSEARGHLATFDADAGRAAWNRENFANLQAPLEGCAALPSGYWYG